MRRPALPVPAPAEIEPAVTCSSCQACCCRLEVILMGEDDVPEEFTETDRWGGQVMTRLEDGWCAALDRDSMNCSIYAQRPGVCRGFEMGGHECVTERRSFVIALAGQPAAGSQK